MNREKENTNQATEISADSQGNSVSPPDASRRNFLKLGLAGAGVAAAAAGGITIVRRMKGIPHDEFPLPVREDFKRIDQRDQINVFAGSKVLNEKHPERNRSFNEQLKKENPQRYKPFHFYETRSKFMKLPNYRDAIGYTQLERALAFGGFYSARQQLGGGSMEAPNQGVSTGSRRCWQLINTSLIRPGKRPWQSRVPLDYTAPYAAALRNGTNAGTTTPCTTPASNAN